MSPTAQGISLSAGGETINFAGELFRIRADRPLKTRYSVRQREFLVCSLELTAGHDARLEEVTWFAGRWDDDAGRVVQSTSLQDNVLFLRKGDVSFFLSLDYPYSRIRPEGISYPANEPVKAGSTHACHTLTVGACRLSGVIVGKLDRAEIEAVSTYVETRFPQRFNRPMFVSACITNRMTDVRDGRIFYSMFDNPTLALSPELLEEDIRLMGEIGVEYFQMFEGVFDWPDKRKTGATLRRLSRLGKRVGVRLGDYTNPDLLYCPHYNYEHRTMDRPEWVRQSPDGPSGHFCLGHPEYLDYLIRTVVTHNRRYREEMITLDMLDIEPCHAADHGHPVDDVYQQVRGLVAFMQALNAVSPDYLIWTNSGNWIEFMPKLTWYNPNVYLTDPHVRGYVPTLNFLKYLGDTRREQMVTTHDSHFVPWRNFSNCEYYLTPRSRVHDIHVFEYSFLQGLAVTPNICPCETRPFLDRIPAPNRHRCIAFMRKWTAFIRKNFDVWQHTASVGGKPGSGDAEVYAHVSGNHGFICLVNENLYPRTARFTLDGTIGLAQGDRFQLREIYPGEQLLAGQSLPFASRGETVTSVLPPHSLRFIGILPFRPARGLQLHGLSARVTRIPKGYRLTASGPQGETARMGLVLPRGKGVKKLTVRQTPSVPMYTFAAGIRVVAKGGNIAVADITFPREQAPDALTHWRVTPGNVAVELPRREECPFLGARVHNAYRELLEVRIDVETCPARGAGRWHPSVPVKSSRQRPVPRAARQTFTTEFTLPFIEISGWGCMPGYDNDTVVELAFTDPDRVATIAARLNGKPAEVLKYRYPKRQELFAYYVELTGNTAPGKVRLELDVRWKKA